MLKHSPSELFDKALKVVESCTTRDQLEAAQNYTLLYFNQTRELDNLRLLIEKLNEKIQSFQTDGSY
jgi:hypothetical protein